ncbi:Uncharacterized protein APZ42_033426 [Daphnia magna]|uniref:Reverse transcriptase domain-containing protein n=1 Tax=Daphnia magna TaxID=35525 RepID=A0A164L3N3_9CRUS|nr:Uncharacterized protein APZ42_033426 [Daphnia magna]
MSLTHKDKGRRPFRQRAYRTSPKQKEIAKNIIEELMQNEIIRYSMSPSAAPIELVSKKTGDVRLCVDFRKLNAITKKDSFPLPRIDYVLDLLVEHRYFSTLDLASGYWQIELDEESKKKTAFIVDDNLYEWNRLAIGLPNAPGTFQRLMNSVLRRVIGKPGTVKELQSFLGLASYYRRFVQNFSTVTHPLLSQTKGKPTDNEFLIYTDSSNYALGAVLSQMKDGKDQPIAYASRHLNKGEIKYSTIEKEAAAVVFGIKHFRHYLQDQPFVIVSDHRPLQWLQTFKDETERLGRWAILLSNMKFSVQYRPGRVHENTDFLSRIPMNLISAVPADNNVMCQEQQKDSLCKAIVTFLEQNEPWKKEDGPMSSWVSEIDYFFVENGLLFILRLHSLTDTNAHPSKPLEKGIENIADIIRAEISGAAHSQYARDRTTDGINRVAREIRALKCENRVLAHKTAIAYAQHSGWLAASYLNLPACSKLIATGESISVYQSSPKNSTITTEITSCGPQPKLCDYTLDTEGWELTPYNPCYWHKNSVNINGRAHFYKNSSWHPIVPGVIIQGHSLINTLPYEIDRLLALSLHPTLTSHPMSTAAPIAEIIAAAKAEHCIDLGNPFHMSTLLSSLQKEKNVSLSSKILS